MERHPAVPTLGVDVGAPPDELLHARPVALVGRPVQRGLPIVVASVKVLKACDNTTDSKVRYVKGVINILH